MSCITEELVRKQSDYMLKVMSENSHCSQCAALAIDERTRRAIENYHNGVRKIITGEKEMKGDNAKQSTGQGHFVNAGPKVFTTHDLSLLIRNKLGDGPRVVVKNIDSETLNDILDIADEIVISRVDAK